MRGIRKKSGSDIFVVLNDEFGLKNEQNGAFRELGRGYRISKGRMVLKKGFDERLLSR